MNMRDKIISAGVRNLKAYGYPAVTPDNILSDCIYRHFFRSMLNENFGKGADKEIVALIAEIDAAEKADA